MGNGSYLPVLILLITSVCAQKQEANLDKEEVKEPVGGRVIRNGMDLQLEGTGERFVTFGTSSWKAMQSTLDDDGGFERDMDEAQRIGMTSVRILATSEGEVYSMPSLQPRPGEYNEKAFQALDKAIAVANERNIRVILVLSNYWTSTGGVDQYLKWARDEYEQDTIPQEIKEEDRILFFNNTVTRSLYMDYVQHLISRTNTVTGRSYSADPGILMYTIMNEPRGEGDPTNDVVHNFLSDMSKFIKSLNSYNLLTTGLESFFGEDDTPEYFETLQPPLSRNGTTPLRSHELENIDVYCFHMWAPQWFTDDVPWEPDRFNFINNWIDAHMDLARKVNKPAILEEHGAYRQPRNPRLTYYQNTFRKIEETTDNGPGAGDIMWLLGGNGVQDPSETDYAIVYRGNLTPADRGLLDMFYDHAERMVQPQNFGEEPIGSDPPQ